MSELYHFIKKNSLFENIPISQYNCLFNGVDFYIKQLDKGEVLFHQSQESNCLYIVLKGCFVGEMISLNGKALTVETIRAPQCLASLFIFSEKNQYPVTAIAIEKSKVMMIPKQSFMKLLTKDDRILSSYISLLSNKAVFLKEKLKFISFNTIEKKLAYYLLSECNAKNEVKSPGQKELSSFFGVARPSLGRVLIKMSENGILQYQKESKSFIILKPNKLYSILQK